MKIISKIKDYYDYLSGVWGVDDKIILDRRGEFVPSTPKELSVLTFIIGGNLIQLYFDGISYYFSAELKQFDQSTKYRRKDGYYVLPLGYINGRQNNVYVANDIKEGFDYLNEKYESPIIYRSDSWHYMDVLEKDFSSFPILSATPITKFIDAVDTYRMISDYLSRQLDKKLEVVPISTDVQKLENKGFDKLSSFRPKFSAKTNKTEEK